jgi:hypothetical protein
MMAMLPSQNLQQTAAAEQHPARSYSRMQNTSRLASPHRGMQ